MAVNQLLNTSCAKAKGPMPSRQQHRRKVDDFKAEAGVQAQEMLDSQSNGGGGNKQSTFKYFVY